MRLWPLPIARATIVAATLYAFLLGNLLGSLSPALPSGLAALCASQADHPAGDPPSPQDPRCCTAACPTGGGHALSPPAALAPSRSAPIAPVLWQAEPATSPAQALRPAFLARGPPLA